MRTYTKEEIDKMRDALSLEHITRERIRLSNPNLSWEFLSFKEIEDRLKTYILAGVEPFGDGVEADPKWELINGHWNALDKGAVSPASNPTE